MDTLTAVLIIEGEESGDVIAAFQSLIDSGVVWQLQGSYGRSGALIDSGECSPA